MAKQLKNLTWEKQQEWHGNPELGLTSYMKHFKNPYTNRLVPVYVYGGGVDNKWGKFVVSAGANSDDSYSGFIPGCITPEEVMAGVDVKYASLRSVQHYQYKDVQPNDLFY